MAKKKLPPLNPTKVKREMLEIFECTAGSLRVRKKQLRKLSPDLSVEKISGGHFIIVDDESRFYPMMAWMQDFSADLVLVYEAVDSPYKIAQTRITGSSGLTRINEQSAVIAGWFNKQMHLFTRDWLRSVDLRSVDD